MNSDLKTVEYQLDNGLKVLFQTSHGLPSATFMIWYKVGSRNEQEGKTGISHFLEHLTFKSTEIFSTGQMTAEITRNGGTFNAYTSRDFTCFFETFATSKLELAMLIESQRMHKLKIQKHEVEKEVGIVLAEIEKNLDNPYVALETGLRVKAYKHHPYKNPVIGWSEDIEKITTEDLQAHYEKYYIPNNATIVVVGNFDQAKTLELIKKYFNDIPPGKPIENIKLDKPQKCLRRAIVRKPGSLPLVKMAYHIPPAAHEDIYPLTVLGEMLNIGLSGRLNQSLVETEIATDVSINVEASKDPGLFSIGATLFPNTKHKEAEDIILNELAALNDGKPPTIEELNNTKRRITSSFEFNRDGTYKYAYLLGYYETVSSYKYIDNYIDNIQKVTIDDIKRVTEKYLNSYNCSIGEFYSSHHETAKLVPTYDYKPKEKIHHHYQTPPIIIDEKITSIPIDFAKKILRNGLTILHTQNSTSDTVKLLGSIKAGNIYSATVNPVLPVMCAGMLNRGSSGYTKMQIAAEIESRGASVGITNVGESISFSLSSTVKDFPFILDILAKILLEPTFPIDEYEKYKAYAIAGIRHKKNYTEYLAEMQFSRMVFPKDHLLYGYNINTQIEQLESLSIEDIKDYYYNYFSPHITIMSVAGNIDTCQAFSLIERYFGKWERKEIPEPVLKQVRLQRKLKEKVIKIKDKTEASVIFGHYFPISRTSKDYHKAVVMNFILGGSGALSSRIGLRIREDMGLVYSISSGFSCFSIPGAWSARFGVDCNYADLALKTLIEEINKFVDKGITSEELDLAKSYLIGSYPLRFNNNNGIAKALLINQYYGLGDNYFDEYPEIIGAITKEDINKTAQKYLHPDRASIVKAGDF